MRKSVARSAAALSYYLTISVFPFLLCASAILGSLNVHESDAFALLEGVMPMATYSTLSDFLSYVGGSRPELVLFVGLTAMLTSSSAAFRSFTGIMGEIQGKMRYTGISKWIISFVFSVAFLAAVYASALIIMSGGWLMQILNVYFNNTEIFALWVWIRFVILFLLLFGVIYGVYIISAPKQTGRMSRLPGALAASVVLVAASIIFSNLVTVSLRYEILYGSLASFIILMIWLYTCGLILIMANVFNITLSKSRKKR